MQKFLIQSDHEVSYVERAALLLLDHPCVRVTLSELVSGIPDKRFQVSDQALPLSTLCPVGSVEFVRAWLYHLGLTEPEPVDYPSRLQQFMERNVDLFDSAKSIPSSMFPVFVKPVATKAWTGLVANAPTDLADQTALWNGPVLTSSVVEFREEYRVYVHGEQVLFVSRYDGLEGGPEDPTPAVMETIQHAIASLASSPETAPLAYALDVGVCADGKIRLVEMTDAWACGLYRPNTALYPNYRPDYFRWLYARWEQIAGLSDSNNPNQPEE